MKLQIIASLLQTIALPNERYWQSLTMGVFGKICQHLRDSDLCCEKLLSNPSIAEFFTSGWPSPGFDPRFKTGRQPVIPVQSAGVQCIHLPRKRGAWGVYNDRQRCLFDCQDTRGQAYMIPIVRPSSNFTTPANIRQLSGFLLVCRPGWVATEDIYEKDLWVADGPRPDRKIGLCYDPDDLTPTDVLILTVELLEKLDTDGVSLLEDEGIRGGVAGQ